MYITPCIRRHVKICNNNISYTVIGSVVIEYYKLRYYNIVVASGWIAELTDI